MLFIAGKTEEEVNKLLMTKLSYAEIMITFQNVLFTYWLIINSLKMKWSVQQSQGFCCIKVTSYKLQATIAASKCCMRLNL